VTIPIVLKTKNEGTYEVQAEYNPLSASKSFWDMVGAKLKTFASVLNNEAFGIVLPTDIEGLDFANGFFPNLLARSGSLKYSAATNKNSKVGKTQYRTYLDSLDRNLSPSARGVAHTLEYICNQMSDPSHIQGYRRRSH
jgi:hypothetical protein